MERRKKVWCSGVCYDENRYYFFRYENSVMYSIQ